MRKTTNVADLVRRANGYLALPNQSHDFRKGVIAMLEPVLHDADVYCGFRWLDDVDAVNVNPDDPDHSRRAYYLSPHVLTLSPHLRRKSSIR